MVQEQGIYIQYRRRPILESQKPLIQHNRLYACFHATVVCHGLHPEQVEKRYTILTVVFYSTDIIALILIGGIKRIGNVTSKLVPFMAIMYIVLALGVN